MSLASLVNSLQKDYEPHRVAAEHFEHARKNAALLREHEDNFETYLEAAQRACSPSCFSRVSGCSCGRQRATERAREPYRKTAETLRRENLSLWSASRLASELGV